MSVINNLLIQGLRAGLLVMGLCAGGLGLDTGSRHAGGFYRGGCV